VIRVVLVDDQTLVRQGIASLLALTPDIRVVAEAADGAQGLRLIAEQRPDVVLLDVRMPGMSGIDVLQALAGAAGPDGARPATLLLTTFDDDAVALAGIRAGARGFLLKDVSLEQLAQAVRTLAAGGSLIQPLVIERVLRGRPAPATDFDRLEQPDPLTPRESEVLRLMAAGYSNREIAEALGTAEGTVKNHTSNILSKLGVRDRTRAVLRGLELGWV
jgi:DNA-binding NarL/FixJ family response regulator